MPTEEQAHELAQAYAVNHSTLMALGIIIHELRALEKDEPVIGRALVLAMQRATDRYINGDLPEWMEPR